MADKDDIVTAAGTDLTYDPASEKLEDIRAIRTLLDYASHAKTPIVMDEKKVKNEIGSDILKLLGVPPGPKEGHAAMDKVYKGNETYIEAAKAIIEKRFGDKLNKCDEWIRPIYRRLIDRADGFQSLDLLLRDTSGLRDPVTRNPNKHIIDSFMKRFGGEWVIIRYAGRQEPTASEDEYEDVMKGYIAIVSPEDNEYAPRFIGSVKTQLDALSNPGVSEKGIVVPYGNPKGDYFIMFGFEHGEKEPIYILADMPGDVEPTHFKAFVVRRHSDAGLMASKTLYVKREFLPTKIDILNAGYFNQRHLEGFRDTIGLDPDWFLNLAERDGREALLLIQKYNKAGHFS